MRELPGTAIREARTVSSFQIRPMRGVLVATVAAILMTVTGAFGSHALGLASRLAYWLILMEAGALIGIGVTIGVRAWGGLSRRPWIEAMLVSLLIALPLTLVVLGTGMGFYGEQRVTLAQIGFLFAMVWLVTATITAVNYATGRTGQTILPETPAASAAGPLPTTPIRPRLADRLAPHLRDATIHALQSEDHYLRVHTDAGSELILMRLGDAIPELAPIEGARTHRSWWVARAAILHVERKDGRAELTLPGGVIAPVSRSAYPELRDAGWFG